MKTITDTRFLVKNVIKLIRKGDFLPRRIICKPKGNAYIKGFNKENMIFQKELRRRGKSRDMGSIKIKKGVSEYGHREILEYLLDLQIERLLVICLHVVVL